MLTATSYGADAATFRVTPHLLVSEIVLPEAVYCCLTRTTLFTTMFTVYYCGVFIEKYVCTKFHLNWLLCQ